MTIKEIINHPNASIIDVRTSAEYNAGHVEGSSNIPLQDIPNRIDEFKSMSRPIVVCCLSGGRSGQAASFLSSNGIDEVYNGGGWMEVKSAKQ